MANSLGYLMLLSGKEFKAPLSSTLSCMLNFVWYVVQGAGVCKLVKEIVAAIISFEGKKEPPPPPGG